MKYIGKTVHALFFVSVLLLTACSASDIVDFVNVDPIANAGIDQTVDEQTTVSLSGNGVDSDGSIVSYAWTQVSGPTVALSDNAIQNPMFTAPAATQTITLEFELVVTDNSDGSGSDRVIITINPVNTAPTADAGTDQTVAEQSSVSLSGTGADADGTIAAYSWTQVSGNTVTLSDVAIANPGFTTPVAKADVVLGFELTVTDDSGATATDRVDVTVTPVNELSFTINGKVVGAATDISNADINVSIGDLDFDTTADAQGVYSVLVNADEDFASELVVLTAMGTGNQSFIKLISAGFEAQELMDMAGSDAILDAAEYIGVNISNVTTAVVAMAQVENDGIFPRNKAELTDYLTNTVIVLAGIDTFQTAVGIKLVMDNALTEPRLALPAGVTDTYQLASDRELFKTYFSDLLKVTELSNIYTSTVQETISNSDTQGAISTMPEVYLADLGGFVEVEFATSSENVSFDFNTDGTGTFRLKKVERNFTWQNATSLMLNMGGAVIDTYSPTLNVGGTFTQVERETIYDSIEITLITSLDGIDVVRYQVNWRHHFPNNEFPDAVQTPYDNVLFLFKEYQPIAQDEVLGKRALPLYADIVGPASNETPSLEMAIFTFSDDGTVTFESPVDAVTDLNFDAGTWELTSDGALVLSFTDLTLEVHKLASNYFVAFALDTTGSYISSSMDYSVKRNVDSLWTTDNIVGSYQAPEFLASTFLSYEGFDLNADGTGRNISAEDNDDSGVLEPAEFSTSPLTWVLQDGKLVISSAFDKNTVDLLKIEDDIYNVISLKQFGTAPTYDEDDQAFDLLVKRDSSPIN